MAQAIMDPEEVRRFGVTTAKRSPDITLVVNLISPNGQYDKLYIDNYAYLQGWQPLLTCPIKADAQREVQVHGEAQISRHSPSLPPIQELIREGPAGTLISEVSPRRAHRNRENQSAH